MLDDTRRYEEAFEDLVESIRKKREDYNADYEIAAPTKENAISLLNAFT